MGLASNIKSIGNCTSFPGYSKISRTLNQTHSKFDCFIMAWLLLTLQCMHSVFQYNMLRKIQEFSRITAQRNDNNNNLGRIFKSWKSINSKFLEFSRNSKSCASCVSRSRSTEQHSQRDQYAGNEHTCIEILDIYKSLAKCHSSW